MYVHIYNHLHLFMSLFVSFLVLIRLLVVDLAVNNPLELDFFLNSPFIYSFTTELDSGLLLEEILGAIKNIKQEKLWVLIGLYSYV